MQPSRISGARYGWVTTVGEQLPVTCAAPVGLLLLLLQHSSIPVAPVVLLVLLVLIVLLDYSSYSYYS